MHRTCSWPTLLLALTLAADTEIPPLYQGVTVTAKAVEPAVDRRPSEVFRKTLFTRDDQVFHLLDAGISAGQHEGGGKSIEIRRFGFNLDHGGVSGGLKVLVDNVQQNQVTQGHGQGYLGSLKSLSPELVQEVSILNGPFSAEYGDFSGLGVVHIRLRESLPDQLTARVQGGSFHSARSFLAYSPEWRSIDSFFAWEGSASDGPFLKPLRYRRDNFTGNAGWRLDPTRVFGIRFNAGRNRYFSSGQLSLDEIAAGRLDRFGSLDAGDGGRGRSATVGLYYRREADNGSVWKLDGFLSRSLFDIYSNFTFFLRDVGNGDGIQQHDSRLQEGANAQYLRPHKAGGGVTALFTAGGNFHENQILVGLYPRVGRAPTGVATRANARVTNGAGYLQESLSLLDGRLQAGGGLRYDGFRFEVRDRLDPLTGGARLAGSLQPKANVAFTPSHRLPLTVYANYGRGISTTDARGVVQHRDSARIAVTDFYQLGTSHVFRRFSLTTDLFWIDRSRELVYIADDGSLDLLGPSRAYGYEAKTSIEITRRLSFDAGLTKVANAFYRGTAPRAPHFVANAGLTVSSWRGWYGSLRLRSINRYRLTPDEPAIVGAGHTVVDLAFSRRIRRGVEFNLAIDNLTDRSYLETQNYFESRLPGQAPISRIHATPGYPITVMAGLTFRFGGK